MAGLNPPFPGVEGPHPHPADGPAPGEKRPPNSANWAAPLAGLSITDPLPAADPSDQVTRPLDRSATDPLFPASRTASGRQALPPDLFTFVFYPNHITSSIMKPTTPSGANAPKPTGKSLIELVEKFIPKGRFQGLLQLLEPHEWPPKTTKPKRRPRVS